METKSALLMAFISRGHVAFAEELLTSTRVTELLPIFRGV